MYKRVFVAGTFDGIHKGHEALLRRAFEEGESVVIGVTSDDFIRKFKLAKLDQFAKYSSRKRALEAWLGDRQATIIPIDDVHEPAATMPDLDAIVVSTKTEFRAREINNLRKKRGLKTLAILEVPMVDAEDKKPISSTRMRNGEIDKDGRLIMPDSMRDELAQPLGIVLSGSRIAPAIERHRDDVIITVGDIATETLISEGVTPELAIIDKRVGRKPYQTHAPRSLFQSATSVISGPGYISKEAINAIGDWAKNPLTKLIIVNGEEDLLALPAIVAAPQGSIVYYGQPKQALWACGPLAKAGLVEVFVTVEKKSEVTAILDQFLRS